MVSKASVCGPRSLKPQADNARAEAPAMSRLRRDVRAVMRVSSIDDVDQTALDHHDLARRLAVHEFPRGLGGQREALDGGIVGVGCDLDAAAQLAVDLHH